LIKLGVALIENWRIRVSECDISPTTRRGPHVYKLLTFEQFPALAIAYPVCQPALGEKVMKNFAGLMQRLLEIQSGEKRRSPELIAEDERLIDGLRKRAFTGRPLQTVNAGQDRSERGW
jgi:hypothetical protein